MISSDLVRAIIWMPEPLTRLLAERVAMKHVLVRSAAELAGAQRDTQTITFVDGAALAQLDERTPPVGPLIVIADELLPTAISWLRTRNWLSHVVSEALLRQPMATTHLKNVVTTLLKGQKPRLLDWIGPAVVGRRVRLAHSNRRVERLNRMAEFFETKDIRSEKVEILRAGAEELLANAFYEAPVAAGIVKGPLARTQEVMIPEDKPVDMVYGCDDEMALVRVRDPFGSLYRTTLVETLTMHARGEAPPGDGEGLWKIFATSSFVAVSVIDNRHTEIVFGVNRVPVAPRPYAYHLFFREAGKPVRRWKLLDANTNEPMDSSITIVHRDP